MTYTVGTAILAVVIVAIGWGARQVRRALLRSWSGPPAWLAEAVIVVAWLSAVAELLGTIRLFSRVPVLVVTIAGAVVAGVVARRWAPDGVAPAPAAVRRSRREEVVAATVAFAVVGAQWISHVAAAFNRGMTHPDTLWYHAPFAARFLQNERLFTSSSTGLEGLATPLHTFLPLQSSLVHAVLVLPYDNDFLSPLLNLGWALVAVLAAWSIARRHGGTAIALLGTAVVFGLPVVAGTQPGQGANDLMAAALCFAAIALVLEEGLRVVPVTLAAIAAGLAIGTKLTVAVVVAVVTVGIVVRCVRTARVRVAVAWCVALALSGGFWFVRNWVVIGNPTPWWSLHLGPIQLDATFTDNATIAEHLGDRSVWRSYFLPGLWDGLGRLWPLLLGLAMAGAVWGVVRSRSSAMRLVGVAALAGYLGYLFTAHSGDLGGAVFVMTLRYLAIMFFIGFTLLAVAVDGVRLWLRRAVWIALLALVLANAPLQQFDGLESWPSEGVLVGVVAALLISAGVWQRERLAQLSQQGRWALGAVALVVLVLGGALVQHHYLENRYVDAGLDLDYVNAALRDTRDERVATFRTEQLYPMFGKDLSNFVTKVPAPAVADCASWRQALVDGGFTYVVLGHGGGLTTDPSPAQEWIATDPAAHVVATDGTSALYRIDGALDPAGCP